MNKANFFCLAVLIFLLGGCAQQKQYEKVAQPFDYEEFGRITDEVVATYTVDSFEQEVYRIDEYHFGSFLSYNGMKYVLGESMSAEMLLQKTPLVFCGTDVYSWVEVKGAAYSVTRFLTIYNNEPIQVLSLEGQVLYHDFDGDGKVELVVSSTGSIPSQLSIMFWDEKVVSGEEEYNGTLSIDVNSAIGEHAFSVRYDEGYIYAHSGENGTDEVQYTFDGKRFIKAE